MHTAQTVIITGASSGIGLALTNAFVARGARVVANSRHVSTAGTLTPSPPLVLVDGDIALLIEVVFGVNHMPALEQQRVDRGGRGVGGH